MKYTPNYGKIDYPSFLYKKPGGYDYDITYKKEIQEKHLGQRWLIVLIQELRDGVGFDYTAKNNLYMDNYGQVWKIYLENHWNPYIKILVSKENDSLYPLSDDLIDLAKATMTSWLHRIIPGEGVRPRATPPKPFLDAFINIGKAIYEDSEKEDELYAELYQSADDYEKLEKEFEIQKKRIDDLEAELLLRKKKMIK
jgi:hypothetical protein